VGGQLRILHVVVNMNRGGAETLLMNLYRNIDRSLIQFDFLTCHEGEFDYEINKMGGKIHRIPYISDVGHFKYVQLLKTFFENNQQYRIVHSHLDKMSGIVLKSAKKAKIPIRISHSHNTRSEGSIPAKFYKWFAGRSITSVSTNFVACSKAAANWLFKDKSSTTMLLKNGINPHQFEFSNEKREKIRNELKIDSDTFVLGHIGRLSPQKNHTFLVEVFSHYYKQNNNSKLLLVGDGPLSPLLKEKVQKLNLEKQVIFTGIRSDIDFLTQAFDVFVFPSFHEGLPVAVIEAQASGLPLVLSDQISSEVNINMGDLRFLSIKNQEIWVESLLDISTNKLKRNCNIEALQRSGFDIKSSADKLTKYYLEIVGG
jgi:glycosyltransferase involved in cell wall biosynthesis